MTNPTNRQDLCERIEHFVQEYIATTRAAAEAAVARAFAPPATTARSTSARARRPTDGSRSGVRRPSDEIVMLSERLYEAVCKMPGETMMVLAPVVGATARELNRSMLRLKRAGQIRSVGTRHATRYSPMASEAARASA